MLTSRYIELATQPIADGDFAGVDVRYCGEFEAIESTVTQQGSIHASGEPDWQQVIAQSSALLAEQSKDLRVACWLAWALYRHEGPSGLQAGLEMLGALLPHWMLLHPRRDRTRAAAIGWLALRLEQAMPDLLEAGTSEQLQGLQGALSGLDQQLAELLGEQAPLLQPLCRQLRERSNAANPASSPAPAPGATASPAPAPVPDPGSVGGSAGPDIIVSPRDAHRALRSLQEQARSICQWWQSQSLTDPRAMSLSRCLLWLPIEAVPEHDANGRTQLRGLPADRLQQFQERLGQGQPGELLRDIESSVARSPFWLDGQHLAWQCLDALEATAARQELELQLGSFLRRLPGIEQLQFFDGTPFANPKTLSWISSRVLMDHNGASTPALESPTDEPWDTALSEAMALLHGEGLKAAMTRMQTGIDSARGGRARLHWQLAAARLCSQAGRQDLARHLLEGMEHTLRDPRLSQWEPQLLVRVMRLLLRTHEQLSDKASRQRRDEIFQRLCHLDFDVVLEQALGP